MIWLALGYRSVLSLARRKQTRAGSTLRSHGFKGGVALPLFAGGRIQGCGDLSPTRGNALWLCAMLNVGANAEGAEVTQRAQKNTKNGFGLG